jgi:hypothetical protein
MGAAARALVAFGLVALTACGSMHIDHKVAIATGYVPWAPLAPTGASIEAPTVAPQPPYPIPAGTPSCTGSQLTGMIGYTHPYPGGNINLPIVFRDRASTDCVVEGYPDLSVLDASGRVLAAVKGSVGEGTDIPNGPVVPILARAGTPALRFVDGLVPSVAGQLLVNLSWYDCTRPRATTLVVELPTGGGHLRMPFPESAGYYMLCDTDHSYRALNRGPFSPAGIEWPPDLHRYIKASVTIDPPAPVKAGAPLVFYVTVANQDTIDYVLDPCPDYVSILGRKAVVMDYRLNCAPVGRIPPGASVKFQMRMDTPKELQPGEYRLEWSIADSRLTSVVTTVQVEMTT